MDDKFYDAENRISDRKDRTMSMAFTVDDAKGMGGFLLSHEFRGPGDTIEAAAGRVETKHGVPATLLLRLRNREVRDMYLSSFSALATAYVKVKARIERAYEHERSLAVDTKITRLADFVAGTTPQA
jgi:hypothetical protein